MVWSGDDYDSYFENFIWFDGGEKMVGRSRGWKVESVYIGGDRINWNMKMY